MATNHGEAWDLFAPPGVIRQGDGSRFQWLNCAAATAAMHAMSERQGRRPSKGSPWPPTGASFRAATGDTSGGLTAAQVDATMNRVYGIDPDFQIAPASVVEAKLLAGYGVTFLHVHGPVADAGLSGSPGFRGSHSAFISRIRGVGTVGKGVRDCDPLFDDRRAEIPDGPQWISWATFLKAGGLLPVGNGMTVQSRYGSGKLYVGFTRVPYRPGEPVTYIRYSVAFNGNFFEYIVRNGVIVDRKPLEFSKPTSAPCSAPRTFAWPGKVSRRLVRVSRGALAGRYVAVPQGSVHLIEKEVRSA